MATRLNKVIDFKETSINRSNSRGARGADAPTVPTDSDQSNRQKIGQPKAKPMSNDPTIESDKRAGGVFYFPLKESVQNTWDAVVEALNQLPNTDSETQTQKDKFTAHAVHFYQNHFSTARARICKLDEEDGKFLEFRKLEGNGFVFADQFKAALMAHLTEVVEDVKYVDPVQSEDEIDPTIKFLDLQSDEDQAQIMICNWIQVLKPKGGVNYDSDQNTLATLSMLGWNCCNNENLQIIAPYQEHFISEILDILRLRNEHNNAQFSLPVAYFGSLCVNKLVESELLDEKNWKLVFALGEAMNLHCLTARQAEGLHDRQVTQSKQTLRLLAGAIAGLASDVSKMEMDEETAAMRPAFEETLAKLASVNGDLAQQLTDSLFTQE